MSTRIARTAAFLLVGLALAAEPALAQGRRDRGQGGQGGQGQGRSAEPRGGGRAERGNGGGRQEAGPRAGRQDNGGGRRTERQPNIDRQPRADVQQRADAQPRVQAQPGIDSRPRGEGGSLSDNRSRRDGQYGDTNRRAVPRPAPYYGDRGY